MEIRARQKDSVIILDLAGRLDVNSANLVEVIGQCLRDGYFDILCNFEDVDFIDYMGISALVIAYKEVTNHNGRLKLSGIPAHLKGALSVAGIDRVIEMYGTEDLAVNSFKEDKVIEDIKKLQLRRRFKRLPIDLKIELKAKHGAGVFCHDVEIVNLSAIGAFIFGCDKFKLGDEVVLKMKLPPKNDLLLLDAKVVWIPDKQVQPHFHPGIGVEFHNISAQTQKILLEFIERNLSFMSSD